MLLLGGARPQGWRQPRYAQPLAAQLHVLPNAHPSKAQVGTSAGVYGPVRHWPEHGATERCLTSLVSPFRARERAAAEMWIQASCQLLVSTGREPRDGDASVLGST